MAGFFLTILLTDGQEGAEENVTHQQYCFQTVLLPELTNNDILTKLTTHVKSIANLGQYHSADLSPLLSESRLYTLKFSRQVNYSLRPNFDSP